MRQFYEAWESIFVNRQPVAAEIRSLMANEIETDLLTVNRQLATADLQHADLDNHIALSDGGKK